MYIKSINNVVGYKDLPDGFCVDFSEDINYIVGANFQRKTTVGSLFNWCLTGTSLYGKEKEQVANDTKRVPNVIVDITFVDNLGIEHRLIRNKGKKMYLILDDKEVGQDMLSEFYKDKDVFLVAHNPYYFYSLEYKQQKDLLRKIVPTISKEDAFKLLEEYEKQVIKEPIENLSSYTDTKKEEINALEKEYHRNIGTLQAYEQIALNREGEFLNFEKEKELEKLKQRYEAISMDFDNSNLEDIKKSINKLDDKINEIIHIDLANISERYKKEKQKLEKLRDERPICPSCRQEIKNSEAQQHLINFQKKELEKLQKKADSLKSETSRIMNEKNSKKALFDKLSNSNSEEMLEEKRELKNKIEILEKEKNDILLHNNEVTVRKEQINDAKNKIELIKKVQEEILATLEKSKEQKKIANKLKVLVVEKQKEIINQYLDKVEIQFSKIYKTSGELTECCEIQYEGRDYKKLSKSQQIRACLEICNVFNNLSGIKAPIFIDDAESTTDIGEILNTQLIVSMVIKYNPLEILYDYDEVLKRKQKSIEKEIQEKESYLLKVA